MINDDDDLKEGLKKSMSEPAKNPKLSGYLEERRKEYDQPHGNEIV